MQQGQRNQPRSVGDQAAELKSHPVFRLYIKAMVDSSGFPSASEMENATKGLRGYDYAKDDSPLVARVKYLHKPVADLLAQREMDWAKRNIPEENRQAIKSALKMGIENYLAKKENDPKGKSEGEIRGIVQGLIDESERDVLRNIDSDEAE